MPAERARHLLDVLKMVPDPRKARGVRHRLPVLLAVAVFAALAGARSFTAIGEWAADADPETLEALGGDPRRRPSESAIRRALTRLDAGLLDRLLGAWLWTRTIVVGDRRVIAIDGKTVRGARTAGARAPHLVAALSHATGTVIGQVATAEKTNEIPTVQELLDLFDLKGAVVTADAMHTQIDTARQITKWVSPRTVETSPSRRGLAMGRTYRTFDEDFKQGAVRVVVETGKPIAQVARDLGVNQGTLGNWVAKQRAATEGGEQPLTETERAELTRLRKENTELRMQRDVLKRSVALWVEEAMGR